ncbi:hypothetical protein BHE74_00046088, partial [Ensete ventricosum]
GIFTHNLRWAAVIGRRISWRRSVRGRRGEEEEGSYELQERRRRSWRRWGRRRLVGKGNGVHDVDLLALPRKLLCWSTPHQQVPIFLSTKNKRPKIPSAKFQTHSKLYSKSVSFVQLGCLKVSLSTCICILFHDQLLGSNDKQLIGERRKKLEEEKGIIVRFVIGHRCVLATLVSSENMFL